MKRIWIFLFFFVYFSSVVLIYFHIKNVDSPWNSNDLQEFYPGLIEPIRQTINDLKSKRKIYVITPTKTRAEQFADLTRLAQTFFLIPNLFWIVVEDENATSERLERLLRSFLLPFVHLNAPTPDYLKPTANESTWRRPRGMAQRNRGLVWLRSQTNFDDDALVYFADDDNTYHWKLFKEIRKIRSVGVWPVGLVGELLYERPICVDGKVHSWFHFIYRKRKFPTDFAGFALHLRLIHEYSNFIFNVSQQSVGQQESQILDTMTTIDQLECLASNASKIFVWHTKTQSMFLTSLDKLKKSAMKYDLIVEL